MKKIALILLFLLLAITGLMALFPEKTAELAFSIERSRSGLGSEVITVDGETWHYLDGGPRDAPVLLLLHGFGGDKDNWTRFSNSLTDTYRIIAPDLPGFGEAARHDDWDYSLAAQRDRVRGFVEKLQLASLHIGGNSMGGHLAALYVHRYPEQVHSLALFNNAGVEAPSPSEVMLAIERGENPLIVSSPEDFDRLVQLVSSEKPFIPWPVEGVLAQRAFQQAAFNQFIFETYRDDRSIGLEPVLADIKIPVFILWGEHDRVIDVSSVDVMTPLLPQAEVVIMEDTGHIPMLERPAETAAHYRAFLSTL